MGPRIHGYVHMLNSLFFVACKIGIGNGIFGELLFKGPGIESCLGQWGAQGGLGYLSMCTC